MKGFEADTVQLEIETQQKVSSAMSAIEIAMSEYEASREKPPGLENRIRFLRMTYNMLVNWEKESLSGKKDIRSRLVRLSMFSNICKRLSSNKELI